MRSSVLLAVLAACAPDVRSDPTVDPPVEPTPDAAEAESAALWLVSHDGTTNWLYRVDPTTFAIQRRNELAYTGVLWELAGTAQGTAFSIDRETDRLVLIDLFGSSVASSVQLAADMHENGRGFGVAPDGRLLGNFAGTLYTIDPATGGIAAPVTLQLGAMAEALESCGGVTYMASRESGAPKGEKLYTVDASGHAALRGAIGATPIDIDSLGCFQGRLYGVDADPTLGRTLFEIAPATGDRTPIVELPVAGTINGVHATSPTPAS